jgi:2,3-bisphosphoglycerate-dependent phosphoglycerate mutase
MSVLILIRHGQSEWNKRNLFTGWVDVPLSEKGVEEALAAGRLIKDIPVDVIYSSSLIRAHMTSLLAMTQHSSGKVPIVLHDGEGKLEDWSQIHSEGTLATTIPFLRAWQLNERMYGELQGMNKDEMRQKFGEEQVHIWRRSFDVAPPNGESLKMTAERTLPFFNETLVPILADNKNLLVSAHGNSIRSILMHLDGLSEDEVVKLEVPTGQPILYRFENGTFTRTEPTQVM